MKNIWKKLTLAILIILLTYETWRIAMCIHNMDSVFNFFQLGECDYVSTEKCVSFKEIWIKSFSEIEYTIIFIIAISILIGIVIGYEN